jgi:hypothetical protein
MLVVIKIEFKVKGVVKPTTSEKVPPAPSFIYSS